MLDTIVEIIKYGLDGNAPAVSSWTGKFVEELRKTGVNCLADRLTGELTSPRSASPYDCGWWNAFSSFAEDLLSFSATGSDHSDACIRVLRGAGISREEADGWLESEEARTRDLAAGVVKKYLSSL